MIALNVCCYLLIALDVLLPADGTQCVLLPVVSPHIYVFVLLPADSTQCVLLHVDSSRCNVFPLHIGCHCQGCHFIVEMT